MLKNSGLPMKRMSTTELHECTKLNTKKNTRLRAEDSHKFPEARMKYETDILHPPSNKKNETWHRKSTKLTPKILEHTAMKI